MALADRQHKSQILMKSTKVSILQNYQWCCQHMTPQSIEDNVGNRFALSQRENRLIDVAYVILLPIFLAPIYLVHLKSRIWIYDHKMLHSNFRIYSPNIIQSYHCICWMLNTDWPFLAYEDITHAQNCYDSKAWYIL